MKSKKTMVAKAMDYLRALLGGHSNPEPPGEDRDPFAYRPVPRRSGPNLRRDAVSVAEPDE